MLNIINVILHEKCTNEEKQKKLDKIADDLEVARGVLTGKFEYCPDCDDYYLAKSFITTTETKETNICTYIDPINSGGNEYERGYLDTTYSICPKGHKRIMATQERRKK